MLYIELITLLLMVFDRLLPSVFLAFCKSIMIEDVIAFETINREIVGPCGGLIEINTCFRYVIIGAQ